MRCSVAIVLDREAGAGLRRLARDWNLWVADSDANRPVVEALWREINPADVFAMAVTIGSRDHESPDERDQFERVADEVIEHFPSIEQIAVVGGLATDMPFYDSALKERGFERFARADRMLQYKRAVAR